MNNTDSNSSNQSAASKFAANWAIRQSQLVREGSWLGSIAFPIPTYSQLS